MESFIPEDIQQKLTLEDRDGTLLTSECADNCVFFAHIEEYEDGTSLYFYHEFHPDSYPATSTGFFRWTREQFEQYLYQGYGGWFVRHNGHDLKQIGSELWDGDSASLNDENAPLSSSQR